MADTLQRTFQIYFLNETYFDFRISILTLLKHFPQGPEDNKSPWMQVTGIEQATKHYWNQQWPSSLTHIYVTRPQFVEVLLCFVVRNLAVRLFASESGATFQITHRTCWVILHMTYVADVCCHQNKYVCLFNCQQIIALTRHMVNIDDYR